MTLKKMIEKEIADESIFPMDSPSTSNSVFANKTKNLRRFYFNQEKEKQEDFKNGEVDLKLKKNKKRKLIIDDDMLE